MKINSITTNTGHLVGRTITGSSGRERKSVYPRNNERMNYNEQINTTIRENSDGRVSFKGGIKPPLLHKIANFTADNALLAEAAFAIVITCILRPVTVMATARNEEDKEKSAYQAAKSISSGLIGLAMTAFVTPPLVEGVKMAANKGSFTIPDNVKKTSKETLDNGVKVLRNIAKNSSDSELVKQINEMISNGGIELKKDFNLKEFYKTIKNQSAASFKDVKKAVKAQNVLNGYSKTTKNIMDKLFQPLFLPLRAMVTIAAVPVVLGALGLRHKKTADKQVQPQANPYESLKYHVFQSNSEKELFQSFSGVAKYENK